VGHYVPDRVLSNADFEKILDTNDEWIISRTGMKERRIAEADVRTSDLALAASQHAIAAAGIEASQIDCIVVATVTPDYLFPATACILGAKLGIAGKPAFDIEIACSGFIYSLVVAASLIRSGIYRRVLIVGAEKLSSVTNYTDRGTAILFGDGAGAAVLERSERDSLLACDLSADGTTPELLYIPAGGTVQPATPESIAAHGDKMFMRGREIFRVAVTKMAESAQIALGAANLTANDVTHLIPHQANRRIIDAAAKAIDLPADRLVVNIDRYGNTSAASIPIALSEAVADGRVKDGDVVLFCGFGGGLSWGSVVWRWAVT